MTAAPPREDAERCDITVSGMTCAACSARVQRALEKAPGVTSANVNLMTGTATVSYDPATTSPDRLVSTIRDTGYGADPPRAGAGTEERIADRDAARDAIAAFARRGITAACLQRHVAGEVIKFYAVCGGAFFAWYGAEGVRIDRDTESRIRALAEAGAASLELEVFGGDCVRDVNGSLWLIDLNDWPSYGRCRFGAAEAIAAYVQQQARIP